MHIDQLEPRRLLSTIVWTNRAQASDRFGEVFGAGANAARAVIDEAIVRWERVITDFNYSNGTNTYNLLVAMRASGTGTGGQGGATATIGGKPSAGTLVLDRGTDGAGAGWYIDPVPSDDVEYNGIVHNAFSASATSGQPFTRADMLTVAMHEIGHCIGLDSNAAMNAFATNTGVVDTGGAHFWAFEGPSVSHLFTGFDSGGGVHNGTQHTADVNDEIFFDGQTWSGANDLMNPVGQTSRRKLIDNVVAWAIHDAWDYDIAPPENFGTFYSTLNRSTGQLLVRGQLNSATPSNDDIEIGLFLGLLVVSVDLGQDVPGTGPLPGPGNVDAFVSLYNPNDVTSIIMNAGDGNDTIAINSFTTATTGVNIDAGEGNDTITLGGGDLDTNLRTIAIVGGEGTDAIVFNDTTDGFGSDSYTFTTVAMNKPAGEVISWVQTENVTLNASPNDDVITVNGTLPSTAVRINARAGNDTFNIQNTDLFSPVTITSGDGDLDVVNVNTDDTANALAVFPTTDIVDAINIGVGGRLALGAAVVPNSFVLVTDALSIDNGGVLDLTNNSMVLDHPAGPSPYVTIRNLIASARAGGAWTGSGITSFAAFLANPKNTTLGMLTSAEYFQINGFGADFAGQNIDIHAICIKFTYYGDTDLNGQVNFDDYARTDAGFNFGRTAWMNGDFDHNGVINFDDYSLIDLAFNTQGVVL